MKGTRDNCVRCGKFRKLMRTYGPGLDPKGEEICRPCERAVVFAWRHAQEQSKQREE